MKKQPNKRKHRFIRFFFRLLGTIVLAVILLAAGLLAFLSLTEFKPAEQETTEITGKAKKTLAAGDSLSILTWNIGYGALGDNADFFMDGGKMVRTADVERINSNLEEIVTEILSVKPDVVFLQETDSNSARSYYVDEYAYIQDDLERYCASFAPNFKVAFLPYPIPPIGKVESGLATFSAFNVTDAQRVQLPVPFTWPMRMANLKRCLLVSRVPIKGSSKELVLVNLHLEAYDDGEGKRAQTKMLADLLAVEAQKGNYVVAGGDFNQIFSSVDASAYPVQKGNWKANTIEESVFSGDWQFLMDPTVPSCRSLYRPYAGTDKASFQYYLIDGFIVSGNCTISSCKAEDLGFTASDHNPVILQIRLEK